MLVILTGVRSTQSDLPTTGSHAQLTVPHAAWKAVRASRLRKVFGCGLTVSAQDNEHGPPFCTTSIYKTL